VSYQHRGAGVPGPYLELFAESVRPVRKLVLLGGNETGGARISSSLVYPVPTYSFEQAQEESEKKEEV
jgi:hypothetical protein